MKEVGIVRKLDELGRIVLPIELRRTFNIAEGDPLEIFVDNGRIVLAKYEANCTLCGSKEDIVEYNNKSVCKKCIDNLNRLK